MLKFLSILPFGWLTLFNPVFKQAIAILVIGSELLRINLVGSFNTKTQSWNLAELNNEFIIKYFDESNCQHFNHQ